MPREVVTQEQYDAWVADIRSGKVVRHNGRMAKNIDELNFIIDAVHDSELRLPEPGIPHILGISGDGVVDDLQKENADLRRQIADLRAERTTSQQLAEGSKIDAEKPVDPADTSAGQAEAAVKSKDAKAAEKAGVVGAKAAIVAQTKATDAANAVTVDPANAGPAENAPVAPIPAESTDPAVAGVAQAETAASAAAQNTK
jgi:hypothetical protein